MKKSIFIFSFLSIMFSAITCRQNDQTADEYRNNLDLKSELQQKEVFKNLDTNSKIRLWKSKLEQIKNENISSEQKSIINNISIEVSKINNDNYDGQKLFEYAIQMAKITPEDEFIRMFSLIGDYKKNSSLYKSSFTNSNIVSDLENYLIKIQKNKRNFYANNFSTKSLRPTCNCRWTCVFYTNVTNDNCNSSVSGCGFLWIQECTGVV